MQDSQLLTKEEITFSLPLKMRILNSYLNAPYLWGGCSVYGIDCSGLSKMFYRFFNLPLPHLAAAQMEMGTVLDFISNAVCGDLAFFENEQQEINHVGILLNDHEIIHASESNGRVTSDLIDHQGIINRVTGKRTHQLRIIKRLYEVAQG
jgi:cell wall-associated NlpC family hydrolase